jgi:predicted nucleotidyltransferase
MRVKGLRKRSTCTNIISIIIKFISFNTKKVSIMSAIIALFPSQTLVSVLSLLMINAEQEFYQLEIAHKTGYALLQVQNALKRIVESGMASQKKRGRMVYYRANRQHPAFEDLRRLLLKTAAIGDLLREEVQKLGNKVQLAFIFGSYARGEEGAESDIDLCLIGDLTLKETSEATGNIQETIGREINAITYSERAFRERHQEDNHFIRELVSCPRIWLIGNDNELKAMVD